jgi:hypothetical protein
MDSLAPWAWWITAGVAGFSIGVVVLMLGAISQSLARSLWPWRKGAPRVGPEQVRDDLAIAIPLM